MICVEFVQLVGKFGWKYYTNKYMFNVEELKTHTYLIISICRWGCTAWGCSGR